MKTIFEKIKEVGVEFSSHQSDLYIKSTPVSDRIVKEYIEEQKKESIRIFGRNVYSVIRFYSVGGLWYEIPFAFDPFWEKK